MPDAGEVLDDLSRYVDLLPEGAVPLYGIRLVCFLDSEGVTLHDWAIDGDVRLGEMIGSLEIAKHRMIDGVDEDED